MRLDDILNETEVFEEYHNLFDSNIRMQKVNKIAANLVSELKQTIKDKVMQQADLLTPLLKETANIF